MLPDTLTQTLDWLLSAGEASAARAVARRALRICPAEDGSALEQLAWALYRARSFAEAADSSSRALLLNPSSTEGLFIGAVCLNALGRTPEAEGLIRDALARRPDWAAARMTLALFRAIQGHETEAEASFRSLREEFEESDPNHRIATYNLSWFSFRKGLVKIGALEIEQGRQAGLWGSRSHTGQAPRLKPGTDVKGKRILLSGEGGAGDELIAARFARALRNEGAEVVVSSRHGLETLLSRSPGVARAISEGDARREQVDAIVPAMDLATLLEIGDATLSPNPYVLANRQLSEAWASRLDRESGLKIGIRWQGNSSYETDALRTLPFGLLEGLSDVPGIRLYSLQRDQGAEKLRPGSPVIDLAPGLGTWEDTAAAIENLDLVITSCTSVAHLASAMGKAVWVLVPLYCYHIWAPHQELSPWYRNTRVFRQARFGSWHEPIAGVREALRDFSGRRRAARGTDC
ncbi:MAG TPA: hypothetical protein VM598_08140 [Bdellovibrionota bacterium]|nr:hypothetical protein [Bdellovibrionota bacterium]